MKKIALFTIVFLFVAGVVFAKDMVVKKKVDQYDVQVTIDKDPPVVGDNAVTVDVKDADGKYVTDEKVRVNYSMPAMPGMPAMSSKGDAVLDGHSYKTTMKLSMAGQWVIGVRVRKDGKTSVMKFNVDAH